MFLLLVPLALMAQALHGFIDLYNGRGLGCVAGGHLFVFHLILSLRWLSSLCCVGGRNTHKRKQLWELAEMNGRVDCSPSRTSLTSSSTVILVGILGLEKLM
jgi:hypothetical protein